MYTFFFHQEHMETNYKMMLKYCLIAFSLSNADKTECCTKYIVESSQDDIMFNCVKSENVQNY